MANGDDPDPIELDPPIDLRDFAAAGDVRHEIITAVVICRMAIATLRDRLVVLPEAMREQLLQVLDDQTLRLQRQVERLLDEHQRSGG